MTNNKNMNTKSPIHYSTIPVGQSTVNTFPIWLPQQLFIICSFKLSYLSVYKVNWHLGMASVMLWLFCVIIVQSTDWAPSLIEQCVQKVLVLVCMKYLVQDWLANMAITWAQCSKALTKPYIFHTSKAAVFYELHLLMYKLLLITMIPLPCVVRCIGTWPSSGHKFDCPLLAWDKHISWWKML